MYCGRCSITVPHFRRSSRTRWPVPCIAMDVSLLLQHSQYALPVGIVLLCAILVFAFGFKKAEQPPFAQLSVGSDVDRKFANKKRSKIKEKVSTIQVNGLSSKSLLFSNKLTMWMWQSVSIVYPPYGGLFVSSTCIVHVHMVDNQLASRVKGCSLFRLLKCDLNMYICAV